MKVCKFGGSSLADAGQVSKVCDIIVADSERRMIVVSAPGKRDSDDIKVTDLLIACAQHMLDGQSGDPRELALIIERFAGIQGELGLPVSVTEQIADDLRARLGSDRADRARFMDTLKAAGEDNCARLVAAALQSRGVDAHYVSPREGGLLMDASSGRGRMLPESYDNLSRLGEREGVIIFPGFFGYTHEGHVVTFPRGGSDITGSILAAAVQAEVYENFTDVDSVLAADPGIVPDAVPIPELSYREMRELSYAGFNVLHDEAIIPAVRAGIPICVRNTNRMDAPGTRIVPEHRDAQPRVVGIASAEGFCTIFLRKYLMNKELGFGRRLLQVLEEEGLLYEHMPSGIDDMSIILREDAFTEAMDAPVLQRIRDELGADDLYVERGLALVMIVGEGMRFNVGVAARATRAFADAGVNIEMINQGSSEISLMFGVKAGDRSCAVKSLYKAFFVDGDPR